MKGRRKSCKLVQRMDPMEGPRSGDCDASEGGDGLSVSASRYDQVDMLIHFTARSNDFLEGKKIMRSGSGRELCQSHCVDHAHNVWIKEEHDSRQSVLKNETHPWSFNTSVVTHVSNLGKQRHQKSCSATDHSTYSMKTKMSSHSQELQFADAVRERLTNLCTHQPYFQELQALRLVDALEPVNFSHDFQREEPQEYKKLKP